jgi:hypothetical protein
MLTLPTRVAAAVAAALSLSLALPHAVDAHGAMVTPRSRNSIDWQEGPLHNHGLGGTTWAWCQNVTGDKCNNGQTAYWYSQGCFIGCDACDHVSGRRQTDLCKKGFVGEIPDEAIAVNREHATGAMRNSKYDIYRHNPWRAPGHAPVADACGLAGGTPWAAIAPEEGQYINTTHAHHGMKGTELPEMPTGTVWKAGGVAPVVWQVRFNHGGGCVYPPPPPPLRPPVPPPRAVSPADADVGLRSAWLGAVHADAYRLCPASDNLTEACFQVCSST